MSKRTEKERVLRALRLGPVKQADFLHPTCDGGAPFLRVAARIYDLRKAGYEIPPSTKADDGTAIYRLVGESNLVRDASTAGGDDRHAPHKGGATDLADGPDSTPPPGAVGQLLLGDLVVDIHTTRPHWMEVP